MAARALSQRSLQPSVLLRQRDAPPVYLAPLLAQSSSLHTSSPLNGHTRKKKNNPNRGISPMRRTGLKIPLYKLSVGQAVLERGLPKPIENDKRSNIEVDEDNGLWDFFNDKKLLTEPEEEVKHGRAWEKGELVEKSFEELHRLWYLCVKDRNRIATEHAERERLELGRGTEIMQERDRTLRKTMKAIKWVLTERWYAWEDAWEKAQSDPQIDMNVNDGETPLYLPKREDLMDYTMR